MLASTWPRQGCCVSWIWWSGNHKLRHTSLPLHHGSCLCGRAFPLSLPSLRTSVSGWWGQPAPKVCCPSVGSREGTCPQQTSNVYKPKTGGGGLRSVTTYWNACAWRTYNESVHMQYMLRWRYIFESYGVSMICDWIMGRVSTTSIMFIVCDSFD